MLIRKLNDVEKQAVTSYGSTGTTIQWLISKEQGAPRFAMRLFTLEPGAKIGLHGHPEEHEIFILTGECNLISEDGIKTKVKATDIVYMPPDEIHGYENIGKEILQFICVIPLLKK
ncbi:MAG: cupin domain-containing protein [Candidatus Thorarchaeota archaeon]